MLVEVKESVKRFKILYWDLLYDTHVVEVESATEAEAIEKLLSTCVCTRNEIHTVYCITPPTYSEVIAGAKIPDECKHAPIYGRKHVA